MLHLWPKWGSCRRFHPPFTRRSPAGHVEPGHSGDPDRHGCPARHPTPRRRRPRAPAANAPRPRRRPAHDRLRGALRAGPHLGASGAVAATRSAGHVVRRPRNRRGDGRRVLHPARHAAARRAAHPGHGARLHPVRRAVGRRPGVPAHRVGAPAAGAPRRAPRRAARRPAPGRPAARARGRGRGARRWGRRGLRGRGVASSTPTSRPAAIRGPRWPWPTTRLLAVACDGRSRADAGLSLVELARLLAELGAREAINLDGGGSTSLVCAGELRNRPRAEFGVPLPGGRAIATALVFSPR